MATLAGTNEARNLVLKAGGTAQLEGFALLFAPSLVLVQQATVGPQLLQVPVSAPSSFSSTQEAMYGNSVLWEKVIVTPRSKDLGFVLSNTVFAIDVWNTHTSELKTLTAIQATGQGDVTVDDPYHVPLAFGPFQSRSYQVTLPADGDASIQSVVEFVFTGESGTDLAITGLRISLFAFDPTWENGFSERTEYATSILTSWADNEQRIQLRTVPRTRLAYLVRTMSARETGALDALLYGWQGRIFGVPFWPDAQPLIASVGNGDTVLQVDTSWRTFAAGGMCMLWRNAYTAAALTVLSVTATTVVLASPVTAAWAADGQTWVVPVLRGRMVESLDERRISGQVAELDAEFECEVI